MRLHLGSEGVRVGAVALMTWPVFLPTFAAAVAHRGALAALEVPESLAYGTKRSLRVVELLQRCGHSHQLTFLVKELTD
jgi:hypothetical protein